MFGWLKKRVLGEIIHSVVLQTRKPSSVFLREKNGRRTVNLKSENFMYVQAGRNNFATIWFELDEVDQLLEAIQKLRVYEKSLTAGAH